MQLPSDGRYLCRIIPSGQKNWLAAHCTIVGLGGVGTAVDGLVVVSLLVLAMPEIFVDDEDTGNKAPVTDVAGAPGNN